MDFGHYKLTRIIWGLFIVMILMVMIFFATIDPKIDNGPGPIIFLYVGLSGFLVFLVYQFIQSFTSLSVFLEGILVRQLFHTPIFLEWSEISLVKGGFWSQKLIIANESGSKKINFEPDFRYYHYLIELLRIFRPDLWTINAPMSFYKSPVLILIFLLSGISLAIIGGIQIFAHQDAMGLLLLFFSSGGFLFFTVYPIKATIQGKGLFLQYFARNKVLYVHQVKNIVIDTQPTPLMIHFAGVKLILKNNKWINLSWFSLGAPMLYAFLATWANKESAYQLKSGYFMIDGKSIKIPSLPAQQKKLLISGDQN